MFRPWQLFSLAPGRQIDVQPLHLDVADVKRGPQQARIAGTKGEMPRRKGWGGRGNVVGIDRQVFARNLKASEERNVKVPQLHTAVETFGEALEQTCLQDR